MMAEQDFQEMVFSVEMSLVTVDVPLRVFSRVEAQVVALFWSLLLTQYSEDSFSRVEPRAVVEAELLTSLVKLEQYHWPFVVPAFEQRNP